MDGMTINHILSIDHGSSEDDIETLSEMREDVGGSSKFSFLFQKLKDLMGLTGIQWGYHWDIFFGI